MQTLAVNTAGVTTFEGAVGGTTPLASLTTDAAGTTDLNIVRAHGDDDGDSVLRRRRGDDGGRDSDEHGDGGGGRHHVQQDGERGVYNLTVNTSGTTTFNGAVGAVTNLLSITTDAPGTTIFNNAPATTTDNQIFNDDVVLSTDYGFDDEAPTGIVHFFKTVNGLDAGRAIADDIQAATDTIFDGAVGNLVPLHDLSVNHFGALPGTIFINGGVVNTTGVQELQL